MDKLVNVVVVAMYMLSIQVVWDKTEYSSFYENGLASYIRKLNSNQTKFSLENNQFGFGK